MKKGKYTRHSIAYDEVSMFLEASPAPELTGYDTQFQKLQDRHIADVDSVLAQLKRSSGAR